MAIPHFSVKSGSRQKGNSAKERFLYLVRQGKYEDRDDLEYVEHRNYPSWAKANPVEFWQAADNYERANGRVYTQIESALPRELSPAERLLLIKTFIDQELGKRHPYTFVVHNPLALDGKENPHLHLIFSERTIDGIERSKELFFKRKNNKHPELGGAAKNRDWNRKAKITELRASWEKHVNQALEKAGINERIRLSSLKKQGIDRIPEPKMGTAITAKYKRGEKTRLGDLVKRYRELRRKEAQLKSIDNQLTECKEKLESVSVKQIPAAKLHQLVSQEKNALYQKLKELKEERYQLGVRWTAGGDNVPSPVTKEQAYEKALRSIGGEEYLELEKELKNTSHNLKKLQETIENNQEKTDKLHLKNLLPSNLARSYQKQNQLTKDYQKAVNQYQKLIQAYNELRSSLESQDNQAAIQSIMSSLLREDRIKQQTIRKLDAEIKNLESRLHETKKYQAELKLLDNESLTIKTNKNIANLKEVVAEPKDYEAKLLRVRELTQKREK